MRISTSLNLISFIPLVAIVNKEIIPQHNGRHPVYRSPTANHDVRVKIHKATWEHVVVYIAFLRKDNQKLVGLL